MAELSEACAQADTLGCDDCPCGQREHGETKAGSEVPELLLQLVQLPESICLDLAPAPPLLGAQLRGQGQAAGSGRDLLLHRHLALQSLEGQLLQGPPGWGGYNQKSENAKHRKQAVAEPSTLEARPVLPGDGAYSLRRYSLS